jgi:hypothetical protein
MSSRTPACENPCEECRNKLSPQYVHGSLSQMLPWSTWQLLSGMRRSPRFEYSENRRFVARRTMLGEDDGFIRSDCLLQHGYDPSGAFWGLRCVYTRGQLASPASACRAGQPAGSDRCKWNRPAQRTNAGTGSTIGRTSPVTHPDWFRTGPFAGCCHQRCPRAVFRHPRDDILHRCSDGSGAQIRGVGASSTSPWATYRCSVARPQTRITTVRSPWMKS